MKTMITSTSYRRQVAGFTLASAVLALGSMIAGAIAVEFQLETFSNPADLLRFSQHAGLAKWSMLLDLFGYYLLLLPAVFYLHDAIAEKTPWARVYTFGGLTYVLIGAIGAAILAAVWPEQMQRYLLADAGHKETLRASAEQITWIVYGGMWNILEVLLSGIWWVGAGLALRPSHKAFGATTIVLGASTLLDGFGHIFGLNALAETGLNIYLLLAIAWAAWLGILIYRGKV